MKVAYIAGPLRAKHHYKVREHMQMAERAAKWALDQGYIPFVPHLNWGPLLGYADEKFMMRACLEMLSRCDLLILIPGWEYSEGSMEEYDRARMMEPMPVIRWSPDKGGTIPYQVLDRGCEDYTD